jgi:hypothetical protein
MNLTAESKHYLTDQDWSALCGAMVKLKDGFTFMDIADALGITKKTAARRVYTLESIHGPVRAFKSRVGMSHLTTYTLSERGLEVSQAIALGLPIPGSDCYQQPKLSMVETAYIAMRRTFNVPTTFVDYTGGGFR